MEVVLEAAAGVPDGSVLSLRHGDVRRQAPASRLGQPFRFAAGLAEPTPLRVELLLPAAAPQLVSLDPAKDRVDVEFGGTMRVTLSVREAQELRRPSVCSTASGESKAASYLEEHDLVRMFQDILHGLLLTKPQKPFDYVEEHIARAKKLAAGVQQRPETPLERSSSEGRQRTRSKDRSSVRKSVRHHSQTGSKVETLQLGLEAASNNVALVFPLLPAEFRTSLQSQELRADCKRHFSKLDVEKRGLLQPKDLMPILEELSSSKLETITANQCRRLADIFDTDDDGLINEEEFIQLVQFVVISSYLESEEGKQAIQRARVEEQSFSEFLKMIEQDKERLWCVLPFLPEWVFDHVTSESFKEASVTNFKALDKDHSGQLEPNELIPVICTLSAAHPNLIDEDKCRRFTAVFAATDGVISCEEFIEFAQFLTVMNVLSNTAELQHIREKADRSAPVRESQLIALLEEDPRGNLAAVLRQLPAGIDAKIRSRDFRQVCASGFEAAAAVAPPPPQQQQPGGGREEDRHGGGGGGLVDPLQLYPVIERLCESVAFDVSKKQYASMVARYSRQDPDGMVSKEGFVALCSAVMVMAYIRHSRENHNLMASEVLLGHERINKLLASLRSGVGQVAVVAPFLPQELVDEMQSPSFTQRCLADFQALDEDRSSTLEPAEVFPLVQNLAEAHRLSLTEENCKRFLDIFNEKHNGVLTQAEYVNLARFMLVLAFLETEEGQLVRSDAEVARVQRGLEAEKAEARDGVEELLTTLERDRKTVHKVIPLLPKEIYDELTGDAFVRACHNKFAQLDKEGAGVLRPEKFSSVIAKLCSASPAAVTHEQCARFTKIFDIHGDGVLRKDEFLDFTRFLCVMSFLHGTEGQVATCEALQIMDDSKKVDELIETMRQDRSQLREVVPYLPDEMREQLLSEDFTVECMQRFNGLDKDGNGTLDAEELYPMLQNLSNAHKLSLDLEQCKRFLAVFDDGNCGVINANEFVNFARFIIIMAYLHDQDGADVLRRAVGAPPTSEQPRGSTASLGAPTLNRIHSDGSFAGGLTSPKRQSAATTVTTASARNDVEHMSVDLDFYQSRAARLASENGELRERLQQLEKVVRHLESKLEEKTQQLRHAELDLQVARGPAR